MSTKNTQTKKRITLSDRLTRLRQSMSALRTARPQEIFSIARLWKIAVVFFAVLLVSTITLHAVFFIRAENTDTGSTFSSSPVPPRTINRTALLETLEFFEAREQTFNTLLEGARPEFVDPSR